jgi:hypothetical protein
MTSITVYHGTGDLEGIARSKKIMSPALLLSERLWDVQAKRYEDMTKELAQIGQDFLASGQRLLGLGPDPTLIRNKEALADLVARHGSLGKTPIDGKAYTELKRNLHVYCSNNYTGKLHTETRQQGRVGALLELEIPSDLPRHSYSAYVVGFEFSRNRAVEVRKKIDGDYLRQVHVAEDDLNKAAGILDEYGFEEIRVRVFRSKT